MRDLLESDIRRAFSGVMLGPGVSLRQAAVIDRYGEGVTEEEFRELPNSEVTDDWANVPWEELERDNVAHLDPEGWRYYIPAFMLSVLESYDPISMRVVGTLASLNPDDHLGEYHLPRYNLLTYEQKQVIARYLEALPQLVPLTDVDLPIVRSGLEMYWRNYLPLIVVEGPK